MAATQVFSVLFLLLGFAALPPLTLAAASFVGFKDPTGLSPYCALTDPSSITLVLSSVGCAVQCAALGGGAGAPDACRGFNYLAPPSGGLAPAQRAGECQLFQYAPNAFSVETGCAFYSNGPLPATCTQSAYPTVPARNCSFPFTYNAGLYYSCIPNVTNVTTCAGVDTGQLACLMTNRTWAICRAPANYVAQNLTEAIQIPNTNITIQVMTVGGWIIYQQRLDSSFSFALTWNQYRDGFGTLGGNYWLGNENAHLLSSSGVKYKIRFEMLSTTGRWQSAEYYYFLLDNETQFYRIHVTGYSGDIPDGMGYTLNTQWTHDGMMFSTFDSNHDRRTGSTCSGTGTCSKCLGGGWWYNSCYMATLTSDYSDYSFWSLYCPGPEPGCVMQTMSRIMIKPV